MEGLGSLTVVTRLETATETFQLLRDDGAVPIYYVTLEHRDRPACAKHITTMVVPHASEFCLSKHVHRDAWIVGVSGRMLGSQMLTNNDVWLAYSTHGGVTCQVGVAGGDADPHEPSAAALRAINRHLQTSPGEGEVTRQVAERAIFVTRGRETLTWTEGSTHVLLREGVTGEPAAALPLIPRK